MGETVSGTRAIQCTEVWGGTGSCDVSVRLAGVRGEVFARVFRDDPHGGDIHFLSVCGMSILSKVVLADVSGHGAGNAEVSRIIHDALLESIGAHDNSTMLSYVNDAFLKRHRGAFKFTTMVAMILDARDRSLVYAYAGHPSILRGDAATGRFAPVRPQDGRGGLPLGVLPGHEVRFEQHAAQLARGDVLVAYTDAFTEARVDGGMLGERGLADLLAGAGSLRPDTLKAHVLDALGTEFEDDASLVILEVL